MFLARTTARTASAAPALAFGTLASATFASGTALCIVASQRTYVARSQKLDAVNVGSAVKAGGVADDASRAILGDAGIDAAGGIASAPAVSELAHPRPARLFGCLTPSPHPPVPASPWPSQCSVLGKAAPSSTRARSSDRSRAAVSARRPPRPPAGGSAGCI
eukprot:scaffold16347_cov138-Isochrysis_galbana.AAC.5